MDMILSWSLGLPLILKHPSYGRTRYLGRVTIAVSNSDCLPNSIQSNLFSHLNWWIPYINNINDIYIKLFDLSSQTKNFVSTPSQQSAQTKDVNSFHPLSYHCSQVYNKKQSLHTVKFGMVKLDIYMYIYTRERIHFDLIQSSFQGINLVYLFLFPPFHSNVMVIFIIWDWSNSKYSNWMSLWKNNPIKLWIFPKNQRFPQIMFRFKP